MQASLPLRVRGFSIRYVLPTMVLGIVAWQVVVARVSLHPTIELSSHLPLLLWVLLAGLVWSARDRALERQKTAEAQARFMASAENGLDAFFLLEAVRGTDATITDFRIRYVNGKAESMLGMTRETIVGQLLCDLLRVPVNGSFFTSCCETVETGRSLDQEFSLSEERLQASWLRARGVKLGDGIALTAIDLSRSKEIEERYEGLASFSDSIFESAPFSIIATDALGTITAMNQAAERLTLYSRAELVGRASLSVLHDASELQRRAMDLAAEGGTPPDGFAVLVKQPLRAEMEEREWTYVRKDGSRTPVSVALRAMRSASGKVKGYVGIASDITDRVQMMSYVTHLATHDHLTGLAGRTLLRDTLVKAVERAKESERQVAVFVLDLDHFKRVNDSLGHQAGDQVIREAAQQLRGAVRATDMVGRMGGDEFVVVLQDIQSIEDIDRFAQNLVNRMSRTMVVNQYQLNITASIGVCIYPDFAGDADKLLERADAAMYESKANGRNQYQIFNAAMLKESVGRLHMEHELRCALRNEEFHLVYQPQVCLRTGEVVGLEALLRWDNRRLGRVSPADFIPLAEETGLIVPIGEWVFRQACFEGKRLGDSIGRDLCVAINLSPRQFRQKNLLEVIEGALAESGLAARNLEIEITENTLMINSAANLEMLQQIRELGVRIAIDDFGTGFCSFSYLLEYHVDRLKIDQSFVRRAVVDANAAAVVRAVIAMSHGLNIKVVAEGVETEEQLRFLRRRRCEEAQGYLFARPITAAEFPAAVQAIRHQRHHDQTMYDVPASTLPMNRVADRYHEVCRETLQDDDAYPFDDRSLAAS